MKFESKCEMFVHWNIRLKMLCAKCWPLCFGVNVLIEPASGMFKPFNKCLFIQNVILFSNIDPITVIFLYETISIWWIFSQQCGYWCTRASVATEHTHTFPGVYGLTSHHELSCVVNIYLHSTTSLPTMTHLCRENNRMAFAEIW